MSMISSVEHANIRPGETVALFTDRAQRALAQAKRLSEEISGNLSELNRWMVVANRTMTWMQALYFSIQCMEQQKAAADSPNYGAY